MSSKDVQRAQQEVVSQHLKEIMELIEEQGGLVEQMENAVGATALLYLTDTYARYEEEITEHRLAIRSL